MLFMKMLFCGIKATYVNAEKLVQPAAMEAHVQYDMHRKTPVLLTFLGTWQQLLGSWW